MTNLKSIRIDDDNLSQADKDNLESWLPNCEINYQTRRKKKSNDDAGRTDGRKGPKIKLIEKQENWLLFIYK